LEQIRESKVPDDFRRFRSFCLTWKDSLSENRVGRLNLATFGFKNQPLIWPFDVFDGAGYRLEHQTVFDLSALARFQAREFCWSRSKQYEEELPGKR